MTMIHIPADERWFATRITLREAGYTNLPHKGNAEMRVYPADLMVTCCNKPFLRGDGRFSLYVLSDKKYWQIQHL